MDQNIERLLGELTLEEKAALCSGISSWETTPIKRLGIPSAFVADGPHGIRKEKQRASLGNIFQESIPSTCFPPACTLAATWNKELVYAVGRAIGEEALEQEVDTVLGPGINIKRNPLCGRNFEYFSEDPYLTGELAASYIDGVQSTGVGTSLKHFAANSQEYFRMNADSQIDERALREIYLAGFERAVKKARPKTVMCSYNLVNGEYASHNKRLLTDILREEWGFDGIVISDWGAVADRVKGIMAGLHLEMPSSNGINDARIVEAVKNGTLAESKLNEIVGQLLDYIFYCARLREKNKGYQADYEAHHALARRAAAEGTVLLKNREGILPLAAGKSFAVIGELAKKMRVQGSGSSKLNPKNKVSFTEYLDKIHADYVYAPGYCVDDDEIDEAKLYKAAEVARDKDYVLVFAGLTDMYESESFDRETIDLPKSHNALINEVAKVNPNIVVVLTCGSPAALPWLDKVKGVLNVYLGGEAGGEAVHDVLWGAVNPSGRLPETWPYNVGDVLSTLYFAKDDVEYRESIFVGYRYFDTVKKPVQFPFGYGLSYTSFEYSGLEIADKMVAGDTLKVAFSVKNTGKVAGAETAQLYIKEQKPVIFSPEKQLRGFAKVFLEPGETKRVEMELVYRDFAFYNTAVSDWTAAPGVYEIMIGGSVKCIKLSKQVILEGEELKNVPDYRKSAPVYYNIAAAAEIPQVQFEALLGRPVKERVTGKNRIVTPDTAVGELDGKLFARIFRTLSIKISTKILPKNATITDKKMTRMGAMYIPLRNLSLLSAGAVPYGVVEGLVDMCNGRFLRGLFKAIGAFRHREKSKAEKYFSE
jgi:beta-glucosidase